MKNNDTITTILASVVAFMLCALVIVLECGILMLCWNYVMPFLFNLPQITLLHSVCIYFIADVVLHNLGDFKAKVGNA